MRKAVTELRLKNGICMEYSGLTEKKATECQKVSCLLILFYFFNFF